MFLFGKRKQQQLEEERRRQEEERQRQEQQAAAREQRKQRLLSSPIIQKFIQKSVDSALHDLKIRRRPSNEENFSLYFVLEVGKFGCKFILNGVYIAEVYFKQERYPSLSESDCALIASPITNLIAHGIGDRWQNCPERTDREVKITTKNLRTLDETSRRAIEYTAKNGLFQGWNSW